MKHRTYALLLAATLSVSLLAGCGSNGTTSTPTSTPAASSTPVQSQTTTLSGTVNTDGSTSMESVVKALAEAFMEQNPDVTVNYSGTGSGTGIQSVIVPEGSDIASVDDLAGKKIGTQRGTTGYLYCSDDFGEDAVVAYDNGLTAVQALNNGQVDAVVIDNEPAKAYVESNPGLKILDTSYAEEDYAIGMNKSNTALLEAVNAALEELKADGTLQAIVDKYIKAE